MGATGFCSRSAGSGNRVGDEPFYSRTPLSDRYKYLFVNARNTDVAQALQHRYTSAAVGLIIEVFCVGNRDYEGDAFGIRDQRAIQGSCIPDLRRFCHSVVAQAQYEATLHFLEVELSSLVQSLEAWLSVFEQKALVTVDPQIITDLQLVRWITTPLYTFD